MGVFVVGIVTGIILIFTSKKTKMNPQSGCNDGIVPCPAGKVCDKKTGVCIADACPPCEQGYFCPTNGSICLPCSCSGASCEMILGSSCTNSGEKCGTSGTHNCLSQFTSGFAGGRLIPRLGTDADLTKLISDMNNVLTNSLGGECFGKVTHTNDYVFVKINDSNCLSEEKVNNIFFKLTSKCIDENGKGDLRIFVQNFDKKLNIRYFIFATYMYVCNSHSATCSGMASIGNILDITTDTIIYYVSTDYGQGSSPKVACYTNNESDKAYVIGNLNYLESAEPNHICYSKANKNCGDTSTNNTFNSLTGKCNCETCVNQQNTYNNDCDDKCFNHELPNAGICSGVAGSTCKSNANHCSPSPTTSVCTCPTSCTFCGKSQSTFPSDQVHCDKANTGFYNVSPSGLQKGSMKCGTYGNTDWKYYNSSTTPIPGPGLPLTVNNNNIYTNWLWGDVNNPTVPGVYDFPSSSSLPLSPQNFFIIPRNDEPIGGDTFPRAMEKMDKTCIPKLTTCGRVIKSSTGSPFFVRYKSGGEIYYWGFNTNSKAPCKQTCDPFCLQLCTQKTAWFYTEHNDGDSIFLYSRASDNVKYYVTLGLEKSNLYLRKESDIHTKTPFIMQHWNAGKGLNNKNYYNIYPKEHWLKINNQEIEVVNVPNAVAWEIIPSTNFDCPCDFSNNDKGIVKLDRNGKKWCSGHTPFELQKMMTNDSIENKKICLRSENWRIKNKDKCTDKSCLGINQPTENNTFCDKNTTCSVGSCVSNKCKPYILEKSFDECQGNNV